MSEATPCLQIIALFQTIPITLLINDYEILRMSDETLYVLKYIFAIDISSPAYLFLQSAYKDHDNITSADLLAALERIYGAEILFAIVKNLRSEGFDAGDAAWHLLDMQIEAAPAAVAMKEAGYSIDEILAWMLTVYGLEGASWEALEGEFATDLKVTLVQWYKSMNWPLDNVARNLVKNTDISNADELYSLMKNAGYQNDSILRGIVLGTNFLDDNDRMKDFLENNFGQTGLTAVETILNFYFPNDLLQQKADMLVDQMLRRLGAFDLTLKLTALKEFIFPGDVWQAYLAVWRTYSKEELILAWEIVYGEHPVLSILKASRLGYVSWTRLGFWGLSSVGQDTLEFNAVRFMVRDFSIHDPVQIAGYLKEAGFTQQEVLEGLLSVQQYYEIWDLYSPLSLAVSQTDQRLSVMLMKVLKEVYGKSANDINEIIAIVKATDFKQEYGTYRKQFVHKRPRLVAAAARDVFPEFSRGEILLVLKAVGYTLGEIYEDILKEPGHLVDTSIVDILKDLGLTAEQAVTHLVNCDYSQFGMAEMSQVITMMDEQGYLAGDYVPYLAKRFEIPNVVTALNNNAYDLNSIAELIFPLYAETGNAEKAYYLMAADLYRGGFTELNSIFAVLLNKNMPKLDFINVLYQLRYVDGVVTNINIRDFGKIGYAAGLTLEEVARAFLPIGISDRDKYMSIYNAAEALSRDLIDNVDY